MSMSNLGIDELKVVASVRDSQARRAIYIDDYMFILSDDEYQVFDENDWSDVDSGGF